MLPTALARLIIDALILGWILVFTLIVLLVYQSRVSSRSAPTGSHSPSQTSEEEGKIPSRRNEPKNYRSIEWKGLIFRSYSEIKIAKTLDHRRIFFIPATRVRMDAWGKKDSRQTRELDFVICHEGKWGILEVDGPYHVAQADEERDSLLRMHGISNIQRFPSQRCYQEPQVVVDEFLSQLK